MKILVVIPTLNEKGNVSLITEKILNLNKDAKILFIDDNSLDGTRKEILSLSKKNKKIKFIFRKSKLGIGSAHKKGINYAFKKNYDIVVTMDCDGTHDPKYISKMLKEVKKFDIINTNRFGKKNAIKSWSFIRKSITLIRHFLIKNLLDLPYDSSGGYRLYNLKTVKISDINAAKHNGYSFLWESLFILNEKKYLIKDIEVILPTRNLGNSKMSIKDIVVAFFYLIIFFFLRKVIK